MSSLESAIEASGLHYFKSGEEFLFIFRGSMLDHLVVLRQGSAFLHAVCMLGRASEPLTEAAALWLLEWNTTHSFARIGFAEEEALLLADLPLEAAAIPCVEHLILNVAAAAEEVAPEWLRLVLDVAPGLASGVGGPVARQSGAHRTDRDTPIPDAGRFAPKEEDSDIDWEAVDV